jgi:sRNA-binding regulator protein Hfq
MVECLNRNIKVELLNGHYYRGKVIEDSEEFIVIIDIENKEVQINKKAISYLEVLK